jgi:HD-GYP domain-containing protein (c-di-GMP phosphodiesterase class II)
VLLRDLGKLGISNDMLYKATDMNRDEIVASFHKRRAPDPRAQAMSSSLRRVIPIIVAGQIVQEQGARTVNVPIEAHILAVADAYQKLTSQGDKGKVFSPKQAEDEIVSNASGKFHSGVVDAFKKTFEERARGASAGA